MCIYLGAGWWVPQKSKSNQQQLCLRAMWLVRCWGLLLFPWSLFACFLSGMICFWTCLLRSPSSLLKWAPLTLSDKALWSEETLSASSSLQVCSTGRLRISRWSLLLWAVETLNLSDAETNRVIPALKTIPTRQDGTHTRQSRLERLCQQLVKYDERGQMGTICGKESRATLPWHRMLQVQSEVGSWDSGGPMGWTLVEEQDTQ